MSRFDDLKSDAHYKAGKVVAVTGAFHRALLKQDFDRAHLDAKDALTQARDLEYLCRQLKAVAKERAGAA